MEKRVLMQKEFIIIGAGASGLCSAIILARKGFQVTIIEQNKKVGKKLLATGNGRCNITNTNISPTHFHSQNPNFVKDILKGFDTAKIEEFFNSIGIKLTKADDGKVYPMSLQASSVVNALEYEASNLGVNIITECKVNSVKRQNDKFILQTTKDTYTSTHLVIATGSLAYSALGGSDSGYKFASLLSHPLIPKYPTLVQLKTSTTYTKICSGVKVDASVKLYANGEFVVQKDGDVLFTDYGVSGLAILDISRFVSMHLAQFAYCQLQIDIMPHISKDKLTHMLLSSIDKTSQKPLWLYLNGFVNHKLAKAIIQHSKTKAKYEGDLNRKEIAKIVYSIKNFSLDIEDTRGFDRAEVVAGGVDTTYIKPKNLESKLIPNLYFLGEVLDVDGDRGGYNLHFAWVCGLRMVSI